MDKSNDKKPWYKKWWLWLIIVIVAGTIAASSQNNPEKIGETGNSSNQSSNSETQQTTFKVGDVINFDNKKVTVLSVQRNWDSGNEFIKPASGKEYIKVEVSIENQSSSEISYNTFDWKLQDSNGVVKDIDSNTFMVDGGLNSGELVNGGKVSGFMIFEVPTGDTGLTLRYSPSFWTDKKLEIKL